MSSTHGGPFSKLSTALPLVCALAACAPNRGAGFKETMASAARANHAGRKAEAAREFERAAAAARQERDRDFAKQQAALAWLAAGERARGARLLEELARGTGEYAQSARFKLAVAQLEEDEKQGYAALERLMSTEPSSGYARSAFRKLLVYHDEQGDALAWLEATAPKVADSDLLQRFAYERARRLEERGDQAQAADEYRKLAERWPYPKGVHFDEALMRLAALQRAAGQLEPAIATYRRLIAQRESSMLMGSYEKPAYAEAQLQIAEIYEQELRDSARARQAYDELYRKFTTSTARDDALFRVATLWEADGERGQACRALQTLVSSFPDSRYVPCATTRCEIERPSSSKAPRECRGYLTQTK